MSILNRSRLKPQAFSTIILAADVGTEPVGGLYESITTGGIYKLVKNHDPNTVGLATGNPVGYEAGDTVGDKVTVDLSESSAGLFAGISAASGAPVDNDVFFIQVGGLGTIVTSSFAANAGDALNWSGDADAAVLGAASNDAIAKVQVTATSTDHVVWLFGVHS